MIPREYNFDATEVVIIDKQIEKFLQTGVIETTAHCEGEYSFKYIHSAQERWLISPNYQFEKSESVCTISPFQNGKP